jgi:hypothetical protein
MPLLETAVAAVGRLALAAVYQGPVLARVPPRRTNGQIAFRGGTGTVLQLGPSLPQAAAYSLAALAWSSQRRTLHRHDLDRDARAALRFRDLLVAGSVLTGLATLAAEEWMRWKYPGGVHLDEDGALSPDVPTDVEGYRRGFRVMGAVHRAFVAGAVAATPFINFALFNAYRPHPIRSLFRL